jgi:hypothetical protein
MLPSWQCVEIISMIEVLHDMDSFSGLVKTVGDVQDTSMHGQCL